MTVSGESISRKKILPDLEEAFVVLSDKQKSGTWSDVLMETLMLSSVERHKLIKSGLRTRVFMDALDTYLLVSEGQLLHAVGMNPKTLSRREESRLGPRHSDAAMALIEVTDMAERVLGKRELAEKWLTQAALALDGQRPLDLLTTAPGIEAVKDLLTRMEYGVYA